MNLRTTNENEGKSQIDVVGGSRLGSIRITFIHTRVQDKINAFLANKSQHTDDLQIAKSYSNMCFIHTVESRLLELARDDQNTSSYRMFELSRLSITRTF